MDCFSIIFILLFISLIFNYLYLIGKKTPLETINNMGLGYNLGNSFDCFKEENEKIIDIDEFITSMDNPIPTKKMIKSIKKQGFKTIRFPITWQNFIDETYKVNPEWMKRVKIVVDLIINENLFCIINIYNDGIYGNWLSQGMKVRDKYISLWKQISEEFKDYNEYLIFESMNELFLYGYGFEYDTFFNLTQTFIDVIRNSGGKNAERLLVISSINSDFDLTFYSEFKIPKDPSNNLAININYYLPYDYTTSEDFTYTYVEDNGLKYNFTSLKRWGSDADYFQLISNFEKMKAYFVDKGIGVIIEEVGVYTEENKEMESIREYLYSVFTMAISYNGMMACLWDTSEKSIGNMNYYNREKNEWYDKKIGENIKKISKKNYVNPSKYIITTNYLKYENIINPEY